MGRTRLVTHTWLRARGNSPTRRVCRITCANIVLPAGVLVTVSIYVGGCKPKPPKFPSGRIERRHNGIEVDELPAVTKGVVAVQEDMAPGHRRNLLDSSQGSEVRAP